MAVRKVNWREVLSRVMAASIGAYVLCYAWTGALICLLPMEKVDATIVSTGIAFLLFVFLILRAFAVRSLVRLWSELLVGTVVALLVMAGLPR
ncbi:MAG: hypothetical protein QM690_00215 [Sphingobium sp.]